MIRQSIVLSCARKTVFTSGRCALTEDARGNKHVKSVTKWDNSFKPLTKLDQKCSS